MVVWRQLTIPPKGLRDNYPTTEPPRGSKYGGAVGSPRSSCGGSGRGFAALQPNTTAGSPARVRRRARPEHDRPVRRAGAPYRDGRNGRPRRPTPNDWPISSLRDDAFLPAGTSPGSSRVLGARRLILHVAFAQHLSGSCDGTNSPLIHSRFWATLGASSDECRVHALRTRPAENRQPSTAQQKLNRRSYSGPSRQGRPRGLRG